MFVSFSKRTVTFHQLPRDCHIFLFCVRICTNRVHPSNIKLIRTTTRLLKENLCNNLHCSQHTFCQIFFIYLLYKSIRSALIHYSWFISIRVCLWLRTTALRVCAMRPIGLFLNHRSNVIFLLYVNCHNLKVVKWLLGCVLHLNLL